jgi:hypothetical protein
MVALSGDDWVLAPCLKVLIEQLDDAYPSRPRQSDGSIGDDRHRAESFSDHNPRRGADGLWYVTAVDITAASFSQELVGKLLADDRVKYIIWQHQYWERIDWSHSDPERTWVPYYGSDPHTTHIHLSVQMGAAKDTRRWAMPDPIAPIPPPIPEKDMMPYAKEVQPGVWYYILPDGRIVKGLRLGADSVGAYRAVYESRNANQRQYDIVAARVNLS